MAITFLTTSDQDSACGFIHNEDVTTYGVAFPDREEDYARAWFAFTEGSIYDENLYNLSVWDFPCDNNHTYNIVCFAFPVWVQIPIVTDAYSDSFVIAANPNPNAYNLDVTLTFSNGQTLTISNIAGTTTAQLLNAIINGINAAGIDFAATLDGLGGIYLTSPQDSGDTFNGVTCVMTINVLSGTVALTADTVIFIAGSGGTRYPDGAVVFYEGNFYFNDYGRDNWRIPSIDVWTGWTVLTEADYAYFLAAPNMQSYTNNEIVNCPDNSIMKLGCYSYRYSDNSGNNNVKTLTVYNYQLEVITNGTINPLVATSYDLTLTVDGTYIVEIEDSVTHAVQSLVIYEYCALENCVMQTIDRILCSGDPCVANCNPCSPEAAAQQQKDRETLNQIIATFGTLLAMIHTEKAEWLGVYDRTVTRQDFITKIGVMMDKINMLTLRCGICNGQQLTSGYTDTTFVATTSVAGATGGCSDCAQPWNYFYSRH